MYRKKAFTGLYTKWVSFTPRKYKVNLIRTLTFRCFRICSSPSLLRSGLNELRKLKPTLNDSVSSEKLIFISLQLLICKFVSQLLSLLLLISSLSFILLLLLFQTVTSKDVCRNIRTVKLMNFAFQNAFYCHVCHRSLCVISCNVYFYQWRLSQILEHTQVLNCQFFPRE